MDRPSSPTSDDVFVRLTTTQTGGWFGCSPPRSSPGPGSMSLIEERADQRNRLLRAFFHQPVTCSGYYDRFNVRRRIAHDRLFHGSHRLLSADREHRHGELCFRELTIVLRVLGECRKLREACSHAPGPGIACGEEIAG